MDTFSTHADSPPEKLREELEARLAELTRANAALVEADRRKDEFLTLLAHDLRNPLATLGAAVELIIIADSSPEDRERLGGVLERQLRQMSHLVDELHDVARILRDKVELGKKRIDLKEIVTQAVDAARPGLDAHKKTLHLSLPDAPLPVDADPARMGQVFANLLDNAAKFTRDGGRIWIDAELIPPHQDSDDGPAVQVRVRDDGIGMTPVVATQVFDLFVQDAASVPRTSGKLGIGLTLVRRLVRLHGGTVAAGSDGLGKGSEFIVRLPLATSFVKFEK